MTYRTDPLAPLLAAGLRVASVLVTVLLGGLIDPANGADDAASAQEKRRRSAMVVLIERQVRLITRDPAAVMALGHAISMLVTDVRPAALAWVDFTEELIQQASQLYGWSPAAAAYKKAQVRAAMLSTIRNSGVALPSLWQPMQPFVFTLVVDEIIDLVVQLLNQSDLWHPEPAAPANPVSPRAVTALQWVTNLMVRLAWWLSPARHLDPKFAARVMQLGLAPEILERDISAIGLALRTNRVALGVLVSLLVTATHEAERFSDLDGAAKKAYVIDIVMAFLFPDEEADGAIAGVEHQLVRGMLGFAIDAMVGIFNRRGRFQHGSDGAENSLYSPPDSVVI